MLEDGIRSARNNSWPAVKHPEIRAAHSRYFAGREADIMALWASPRQRAAYDWFTLGSPESAHRVDHLDQGDLDVAATIASYAGLLGTAVQTLRADSLG